MLLGDADGEARPIAMVPIGGTAEKAAFKLAQQLRRAGYSVDVGFSGNIGRRMKRADKVKASATVIIGDNELAKNAATVRDMDSGEQTEVSFDALERHLARYRGEAG